MGNLVSQSTCCHQSGLLVGGNRSISLLPSGRTRARFLSTCSSVLFGSIRAECKSCSIRLVQESFPDFKLRFGRDLVEGFELTEAVREGRKIGDECRLARDKIAAGQSLPFEGFD